MGLKSYPRIYFELIFIGSAIEVGMGLPTSFLPIFASELDPSGALVGFVVSAWFLSRVFIELPAGLLSDRIGRRKLLLSGVGLSVLGVLLCAQSKTVYFLILGRAIWGLGTALVFVNSTALIFDLFASDVRGRALGFFYGIEWFGFFAGAPIGAFLAGVTTYNNVFYFNFVLALSAFAVALSSKRFKTVEKHQRVSASLSITQTFQSLRNWSIAIICVITFFRILVMQGIFSTVFQLYLNQELLFPIVSIGLILGCRTASHIFAAVFSGFLSDRFGRTSILMMGFLFSTGCLAAFTVVSNIEMFFLIACFQGFGEGLASTSLIVLLSEVADPSGTGGAIGLYRTFIDFGGFVGPLVLMFVYNTLSPQAPFYAALCAIVLNLVLTATMRLKLLEKKTSSPT